MVPEGRKRSRTDIVDRRLGEGANRAGLAKSRPGWMHRELSGFVEREEMPGLVVFVGRHGDTQVQALGSLAFSNPEPMQSDAIFRIASITKPITVVASIILVEDCKPRLDESIEP
jgi:CubicO group peptidase (beta-lactamase class C family)